VDAHSATPFEFVTPRHHTSYGDDLRQPSFKNYRFANLYVLIHGGTLLIAANERDAVPKKTITGATVLSATLAAKRLAIVRELIPSASLIGALLDPNAQEVSAQLTQLQAATRATGQQVHILTAGTENDIETAFATISGLHIDVLLVGATPFFRSRRSQIAALAARYAIPTFAEGRDSVESGLLMSYGPSITDIFEVIE
jgi:putative ABC transport system substrate-binding protein